jgi:hypothetical protein
VKFEEFVATDVPVKSPGVHVKNMEIGKQQIQFLGKLMRLIDIESNLA